MTQSKLAGALESHGQAHVLKFWDELSTQQQQQLDSQLAVIDFEQLASLVAGEDKEQDFAAMSASASPPPAMRADGTGASWTVDDAKARGEAALRAGEVAAVLVAGGQGTRLGFDQPKGMFPIGPVSNRTLFQIFADRLIAIAAHYKVDVPLFIMTSEATDAETRAYFADNNYLGLDPANITIFQQGTMPAVNSSDGKLLLASKASLALSPDGHGGTVRALLRNGCLDAMESRGVKHVAYFQVDNPLVCLCDPTLIGHHLMAESEMTTQVVRKRYPMEKVGNVVLIDGRLEIIEYSDLPESAAEATDDDGEIRLWAGNIAVHVIDVGFLRRVSVSDAALPFHRASKKVPFIDDRGGLVEPNSPNATKFERFIFDLLPAAKNAFVVEALATEAFAPVKNADGAATDTPALAREAIANLHRRWLEHAGFEVAEGISVEINPRFSLFPEQLPRKLASDGQFPPKSVINQDQYFDSELE